MMCLSDIADEVSFCSVILFCVLSQMQELKDLQAERVKLETLVQTIFTADDPVNEQVCFCWVHPLLWVVFV